MPRSQIVPGPSGNQRLEQNKGREGKVTRGFCSSLQVRCVRKHYSTMQMKKHAQGPLPHVCQALPTAPYGL